MSEQHGVSGAITHIRSSEVNRKKPNSIMWGFLCGSRSHNDIITQ